MFSTYTVTSLADVLPSAPNYDGTLRWAVQQADNDAAKGLGPDTINFASKVKGTITLLHEGLVLNGGTTTVDGPGASVLSVSGNHDTSDFVIEGAKTNATISGLTLTEAKYSAIQNFGSRLTLDAVTFSSDSGGDGGGLYNSGTAVVVDSYFPDDSAASFGGSGYDDGGAIYSSGSLTVTGTYFASDIATNNGGGIYNAGGKVTINGGSEFVDEVAAVGGGIYNKSGGVAVTGGVFGGDSSTASVNGGGGIANFGTLTATSCSLYGNAAHAGGDIFNGAGGTATVNSTYLDTSSAKSGGGAGIFNAGALSANGDLFSGDTATGGSGGAIFNNAGGSAIVTNANITDDSAKGEAGGGIFNAGKLALTDSTLSSDSAKAGGGLYNFSSAKIVNSTFSGDSASGDGGGIFNDGGLYVYDSTIARNSAASAGGIFQSAFALLDNTIVDLNSAASADMGVEGSLSSASGYNLIGNGTGMTGIFNGVNGNQVGTAAKPINALLGPLTNNGGPTPTMLPLKGSPAINRGSNALIPAGLSTDQRGYARVDDGIVDIGAVET